MCIIAVLEKGVNVNKAELQTCFKNNPDGAGFMYQVGGNVHIKKGFMNFKEFWTEFSKIPSTVHRVAHFRIATSGKISPEVCHPFALSDDYETMRKTDILTNIGIAHNGVISFCTPTEGLQSSYSDTMMFIKDYLWLLKDHLYSEAVETIVSQATTSRFAILSEHGIKRIGTWEFSKRSKIWYSNTTFEKPRIKTYPISTFQKSSYEEYGILKYIIKTKGKHEYNYKEADQILKTLENSGNYIEDYDVYQGCYLFRCWFKLRCSSVVVDDIVFSVAESYSYKK